MGPAQAPLKARASDFTSPWIPYFRKSVGSIYVKSILNVATYVGDLHFRDEYSDAPCERNVINKLREHLSIRRADYLIYSFTA